MESRPKRHTEFCPLPTNERPPHPSIALFLLPVHTLPETYPHIQVLRSKGEYTVVNLKYLRQVTPTASIDMNLTRGSSAGLSPTLGRASQSYERDLTAAIIGDDKAVHFFESQAQQEETSSPNLPPDWSEDRVRELEIDLRRKFRKGWNDLKRQAKTSSDLDLIKNAKISILDLLVSTKVVYDETIQLLDLSWDLLGPDVVAAFFELLIMKSTDQRLTTKDGLHGAIWGLKNGKIRNDCAKVTEVAEVSAMLSADLKLCSSEARTFKESQDQAEKQWGAQSSLISGYKTKLETLMKEFSLKLETPAHPSTVRQTQPVSQKKRLPDDFILTISEGKITQVDHQDIGSSKRVAAIISQTRQLYGSKTMPFNSLTSISPGLLYETFKRNVKIQDGNIQRAMVSTFDDLSAHQKQT